MRRKLWATPKDYRPLLSSGNRCTAAPCSRESFEVVFQAFLQAIGPPPVVGRVRGIESKAGMGLPLYAMDRPGIAELYSAIARPKNLGSPSCTRPFLNPNKTTGKLFPEAISAFRFRYLFRAGAGPGDGTADYPAVGGFHVAEGKNTRTVAVKLQTPGAPVVL
jgi:hypothetical protein